MPRKSTAALLALPAIKPPMPRLRAPADLTPAQAAHWHAVIDSLPGGYVGPEAAQQMRAYCVHAALADDLAQRLTTLDPLADGWVKLSACQVSHSKAALAFARALRLTTISRMERDTAATRAAQRGPATLEQMRQRYGAEHEG
jgi:hypothetical protein